MKIKVAITNLDCPNCARSLENEINKLEGIKNAKLDFLKSSLIFESENSQKALDDIIKLTSKLEPDAKILSRHTKTSEKSPKFNKNLLFDILYIAFGIAFAIVILCIAMPNWAFWMLYATSALLLGWKTYFKAFQLLLKGVVNENLLITISVVGASIVGEHLEGLMVIALYSIGKIFEGLAVNKSRKSIEKLAKLQPEYAVVLDETGEHKCRPNEVEVGSILIVKPGEKVAIDGVVCEGCCSLDMQSLTGESMPVHIGVEDKILSGSIVLDGVLKIRTTSKAADSTISKIMNLVENATENKSRTETFISRLTKWYTLGIVILAVIVWAIVWALTKDLSAAFYRGLIFLVISCPCAFAISVPLSYFSGLGNASKHGVLIKGSNFLDTCSRLKTVAFDKTGTLTTGQFTIEKVLSFDDTKSEDEILFLCALGEQNSIHPLAKAITSACKAELESVKNVKEVAGYGIEFSYGKKTYFVGRKLDEAESKQEHTKNFASKQTTVLLYENNVKIGEILLKDTIKHTSKETCQQLSEMKIKTVLLSGDTNQSVQGVAKEIGVTEALGEMLPQDKYAWIESHKHIKNAIGYVGDGINDAPSLALADVGISMGINGSPASVEASDVVIVDDNPQKVVAAIKISKFTRKIVMQTIIFSAAVKIIFLLLGSFGITGMLAAVFADVGVTLLAIFNSLRALKYKPK